jgi:exonuclease VII small subunit
MKKYTIFIPSLLLVGSAWLGHTAEAQSVNTTATESLEPVMCTMDVQQCPDGSFVGRTGPQCEFVCPASDTTFTDVTDDATEEVGERDRDRLRDSSVAESVEARRAEFENNQEVRQELRTERQEALSEIRQQRIINLAANISNRMDAAVERLFAIIGRLESRIAKLELAGQDTTRARTSLQSASQSLAEARGLLSDIDSAVIAATTSEEPYTAWQELRTRYQSIAERIRNTHSFLRDTLTALKTPTASVPENTPTPETAVNPADLIPSL